MEHIITTQTEHQAVSKKLAPYSQANRWRAYWQLATTLLAYASLILTSIFFIRHGISYWYSIPLLILAGGFLVRIFIIFHDCTHNSFLPTARENKIVGTICGFVVFTPFAAWQASHAAHHRTVAKLHDRGEGDVWTMTVQEYQSSPWYKKTLYRIFRFPPFLFLIAPPFLFFILQRFPAKGGRRHVLNLIYTNCFVLIIFAACVFFLGLKTYLLVQLPIMSFAGTLGVWLFYVQHQFKAAYWADRKEWSLWDASMRGSSYYRLPRVLEYFTGSIGYHHIHHLNANIPNYNLRKAQRNIPELNQCVQLTLSTSLKSLFLFLYDEERKMMVGFGKLKPATVNS